MGSGYACPIHGCLKVTLPFCGNFSQNNSENKKSPKKKVFICMCICRVRIYVLQYIDTDRIDMLMPSVTLPFHTLKAFGTDD